MGAGEDSSQLSPLVCSSVTSLQCHRSGLDVISLHPPAAIFNLQFLLPYDLWHWADGTSLW